MVPDQNGVFLVGNPWCSNGTSVEVLKPNHLFQTNPFVFAVIYVYKDLNYAQVILINSEKI